MDTKNVLPLFMMAAVLLLPGCGSSSSDDPVVVDDSTEERTNSGNDETPVDDSTEESPNSDDDETPVISDLNNPMPFYRTEECGFNTPVTSTASTNADAPTPMTVNTVVSGRIDPDSATNTQHYWSIDLDAGYYHVVLDSARTDEKVSNVGLKLVELNKDGSIKSTPLSGNGIDVRMREYEFLEVPFDTTLLLRIEPRYAAEDYQLAFFENGENVPTPYLTDCPNVLDLEVGSDEMMTLAEGSDPENRDQWYKIDAEAIDYLVTAVATRLDGEISNIQYSVLAYDQFTQHDRKDEFFRLNEIAITYQESAEWKLSEQVPRWLRVVNRNDPISVTILVEENN